MMNSPLSSSGQLARYFVAGPLVLAVALGISGARAQSGGPVGPTAAAQARVALAVTSVAAAKVPNGATRTGLAVDPPTHQLPDGIKAHIAKTYPGSTIVGYFVTDHASEKAPHIQYYASITTSNGQKRKLFFNGQKEPVAGPSQVALATPKPDAPDKSAPRAPGLGNSYYRYGQTTPIVYLDGQRYAGDLNSIDPKSIANISIFKGDKARQRFGAEAADGAIVVTTIARQNDAEVNAFNQRVDEGVVKPLPQPAAQTPPPTSNSVPYLAAPALAYITQHYPAARLLGVTEVPGPDGGPARYQAQIVIGRRPGYLLFDAAGQFISDSYNSSAK